MMKKNVSHFANHQLAHHQQGHAWTEIILGSLLMIVLSANSIRGYQMLQQSKAVQLHYHISQILSAWYDFKDKYHALPGDYAFAHSDIDSSLRNGNGNGLIDSDQERGQVWADLAAVGLLANRFDGGDVKLEQRCSYTRCPENGFGANFVISHQINKGNILLLGDGIALKTLSLLDQQIDDGLPQTGKVQLLPTSASSCYQAQHYAQSDATNCQVFLPIP